MGTGDYSCTPSDTSTLAKYNTHWNVKYGAPSASKFNRGGHLVEFQAINGQNLFQFDYPTNFSGANSFFQQLNRQCACGGKWNPKGTRSINQHTDCSSRDKAETDKTQDICNI